MTVHSETQRAISSISRQRDHVRLKLERVQQALAAAAESQISPAQLRTYMTNAENAHSEFNAVHSKLVAIVPEEALQHQEEIQVDLEDQYDRIRTTIDELMLTSEKNPTEAQLEQPLKKVRPVLPPTSTFRESPCNWPARTAWEPTQKESALSSFTQRMSSLLKRRKMQENCEPESKCDLQFSSDPKPRDSHPSGIILNQTAAPTENSGKCTPELIHRPLPSHQSSDHATATIPLYRERPELKDNWFHLTSEVHDAAAQKSESTPKCEMAPRMPSFNGYKLLLQPTESKFDEREVPSQRRDNRNQEPGSLPIRPRSAAFTLTSENVRPPPASNLETVFLKSATTNEEVLQTNAASVPNGHLPSHCQAPTTIPPILKELEAHSAQIQRRCCDSSTVELPPTQEEHKAHSDPMPRQSADDSSTAQPAVQSDVNDTVDFRTTNSRQVREIPLKHQSSDKVLHSGQQDPPSQNAADQMPSAKRQAFPPCEKLSDRPGNIRITNHDCHTDDPFSKSRSAANPSNDPAQDQTIEVRRATMSEVPTSARRRMPPRSKSRPASVKLRWMLLKLRVNRGVYVPYGTRNFDDFDNHPNYDDDSNRSAQRNDENQPEAVRIPPKPPPAAAADTTTTTTNELSI